MCVLSPKGEAAVGQTCACFLGLSKTLQMRVAAAIEDDCRNSNSSMIGELSRSIQDSKAKGTMHALGALSRGEGATLARVAQLAARCGDDFEAVVALEQMAHGVPCVDSERMRKMASRIKSVAKQFPFAIFAFKAFANGDLDSLEARRDPVTKRLILPSHTELLMGRVKQVADGERDGLLDEDEEDDDDEGASIKGQKVTKGVRGLVELGPALGEDSAAKDALAALKAAARVKEMAKDMFKGSMFTQLHALADGDLNDSMQLEAHIERLQQGDAAVLGVLWGHTMTMRENLMLVYRGFTQGLTFKQRVIALVKLGVVAFLGFAYALGQLAPALARTLGLDDACEGGGGVWCLVPGVWGWRAEFTRRKPC